MGVEGRVEHGQRACHRHLMAGAGDGRMSCPAKMRPLEVGKRGRALAIGGSDDVPQILTFAPESLL